MNRRTFLERVCQAGAGIVIGGAVLDMSTIRSITAHSRMGINEVREVPINLTDTPELAKVGGYFHLSVEDLEREILVVHTSASKYIAVDIKCTHRGCDIGYDTKEKKFVCPCHGSEYDLTGLVTKGPASNPLNYYKAELKGDEVIVTVYGSNEPVPPRPGPDTTVHLKVPEGALDSTLIDSLIHVQH